MCDFPSAGINEIAKTRHCTNHLHVTYIPVHIIQATSNWIYYSFISSRNWNNTAKIWNKTTKAAQKFPIPQNILKINTVHGFQILRALTITKLTCNRLLKWFQPVRNFQCLYLWWRWQWTKIERRNSMRKIWLKAKNNLNHEISKAVQLTLYTHVFCHYWWNISR